MGRVWLGVEDGHALKVVCDFPASLVIAFGKVGARHHGAVVHAHVVLEALGHGQDVRGWHGEAQKGVPMTGGVVDRLGDHAEGGPCVFGGGDARGHGRCVLFRADAHAHAQSSPTMSGFSPARPASGAPPMRMIFSRNRPKPSMSASGRGGHPGM